VRERLKADAQAAIDAATVALSSGAIDDLAWCERVSNALASSYLAEDDPRWQSGYDGDAAAWREARELVLDAVGHDGSFLDVGCANGHLMECLAEWGEERRLHLTMHGLELDPDLANAARRRLARWADHIHAGNVLEWQPPTLFTYVRTGLEYVPPHRRAGLVRRLLFEVVEPGGRLIVGPVKSPELEDVLATIREAGVGHAVVSSATDGRGTSRHVVYVGREPDDR
jgi:trans-aconitate methyltransferase